MFRRITKREAVKRFADGTSIICLCPCNFAPGGPWSMACRVSGCEYLKAAAGYTNHPTLWEKDLVTTAWGLMYRDWEHYNTSNETGYYAHYYIEE